MPCGYKLSPAAQKRGFACGILFLETTPSVSPCSTAPSWREPRRISLFPCLLVAAEQISQAVRFARGFAPMLAAPLPANLLLRKIFAGALYKRGVPRARKAGVWRKELPYFSLPCVRGEQALSCKEPGGLFAACELGNGALCAPFPDRSAVSTARDAVSSFGECR